MAKSDPARRPLLPDEFQGRVRFDKWLWAARFYKTRSLAAQAIESGQARLNQERVKPAHVVRPGDVVAVKKQGTTWDAQVLAVDEHRRSAADAALLYAETPQSLVARAEEAARRKAAAEAEPRYTGRPTKRQRRKLEDFLNEP